MKTTTIKSIITALAFTLFSPGAVFAQPVVGTIMAPSTVANDIGNTGILLTAVIRFIIVAAGLFALFQFVLAGLGYISSNGDKGKIQESTQKMFMSILGLVVMGSSFIITTIVTKLLFGTDFDLFSLPLLKI